MTDNSFSLLSANLKYECEGVANLEVNNEEPFPMRNFVASVTSHDRGDHSDVLMLRVYGYDVNA